MSLTHYRDLASNDDAIRLKAAHSLLSELSTAPTDKIEYALNRLIRGLASGRESSRIGFSITLTELLAQLLSPDSKIGREADIDFARILDILKSRTHPEGSITGQEERDYHFGRLFGLEALIKSSILFGPESPLEHWIEVLDLIFELAKKKSWLREECGWIIYDALPAVAASSKSSILLQTTIEKLCANGLAKTPEGVTIWLFVRRQHEANVPLPQSTWQYGDPLDTSNLKTLAKVMKESSTSEEESSVEEKAIKRKGSWTSKLHFAWGAVLEELYPTRRPQCRRPNAFREFWETVVDENLFSASASEERKLWGFLLFCQTFEKAPVGRLPILFSKNFLRCLINQLSDPERYLHKASQKVLRTIHTRVESDPELTSVAICGFIAGHGTPNFDQVTKTKTVAKLLSQANSNALDDILRIYSKAIKCPSTDDPKIAESRRQLLADQLVGVLRSGKSEKPKSWIKDLLSIFVQHGYFDDEKLEKATPVLSDATHSMFRSRLSSCLAHLISSKTEDGDSWPFMAVQEIPEYQALELTPVIELDDTVQEARDPAMKTLWKIHEKRQSAKRSKKATLEAFELLYSLVILQLYNGDSESLVVLDELKTCYDKVVGHKKADNNDIDATEVLVEILLSFISKPSVLLRKLAQQVFSTFSGNINAGGLQQLLNVLETKESLAGQQDLFDQEGEDDSDDDDEDDDVEEMDVDEAGSEDSDDHEESEDGDSASGDDSDDMEDDEADGLDAAIAAALGTRTGKACLEDGGASSDSDADMNDDEMIALDEQLVKIFKERKKLSNKKKEKMDARTTIVNFKTRVLDLLEIYIKQQHTNSLSLMLILPLLKLIRSTSSKQLSTRAATVLKEYTHACKGKEIPPPTANISDTWTLLRSVHDEAMRETSHAHMNACSQASLLLVKVLVGADRKNVKGCVETYANTWTQWLLSKKCKVQPGLFSDFVNWSTSASKQLQR